MWVKFSVLLFHFQIWVLKNEKINFFLCIFCRSLMWKVCCFALIGPQKWVCHVKSVSKQSWKLANWIDIDQVMKLLPTMYLFGKILYYRSLRNNPQTTFFAKFFHMCGRIHRKFIFYKYFCILNACLSNLKELCEENKIYMCVRVPHGALCK